MIMLELPVPKALIPPSPSIVLLILSKSWSRVVCCWLPVRPKARVVAGWKYRLSAILLSICW